MKKLFVLGSAALLILISSVPDVARGAPAGSTKPSMENAVIVAQLVPAVVQQDLIASMADEIVIALCAKALPMEIIGIARSCDDVQEVVVAGTEKVDAFGRPSYGFAKKEAMTTAYVEMLGAVETANRSPLVQRI